MKKVLSLLLVPVIALAMYAGVAVPQASAQLNRPEVFRGNDAATNAQGVAVAGTENGRADGFINVVKSAINWILGILSLIALIVLLWGGFQMVTAAGNEDQYNKGFTILKQAAIGLILIGVAWFIVSIIFWLVGLVTDPANSSGAGTDT